MATEDALSADLLDCDTCFHARLPNIHNQGVVCRRTHPEMLTALLHTAYPHHDDLRLLADDRVVRYK